MSSLSYFLVLLDLKKKKKDGEEATEKSKEALKIITVEDQI